MNVSVLLRLIPPERTGGRLAGQAELVETGETTVFADHDEMLDFLRHVSGAGDVVLDEPFGLIPRDPQPDERLEVNS